jgi:hypothetical protein
MVKHSLITNKAQGSIPGSGTVSELGLSLKKMFVVVSSPSCISGFFPLDITMVFLPHQKEKYYLSVVS